MQPDTSVINLNTSLIIPNKYQPRKVFDEKELESLSSSIKTYGIINPILVRKKDDKYEIIAGERRFRAAQKLGLSEVPVIIKNANEQQMAELALIENLHRQGLTSIEEAKSYEEILKIGNQTQSSLAEKLGKSQSSIANKIRLLSLPQEIQDALAEKKISERHARSLLSIENKEKQIELLNRIITEKLTVKETDQIINQKEITEEEIKNAISDIMKSLNIKEEEKEDDNMNNGNFFPNFDNNNVANNNASLNMMNMQSMAQPQMMPEPEMVMPTMAPPVQEPQMVLPTQPVDIQPQMVTPEVPVMPQTIVDVPLFNPTAPTDLNLNNTFTPMSAPVMESPIINDAPLFGPTLTPSVEPVNIQPEIAPQVTIPEFTPVMDAPLFTQPEQPAPLPVVEPVQVEEVPVIPAVPEINLGNFDIPVTNNVTVEMPVAVDKLTQLQELLNNNGYTYKLYSNETDNCVIIELPKN